MNDTSALPYYFSVHQTSESIWSGVEQNPSLKVAVDDDKTSYCGCVGMNAVCDTDVAVSPCKVYNKKGICRNVRQHVKMRLL